MFARALRRLQRPAAAGVAAAGVLACYTASRPAVHAESPSSSGRWAWRDVLEAEATAAAAAKKKKGGKLIVVGEALIDFIPGESDGRFLPRCGGAPFNVCLTMARLEAPTAFLSNVSADMFGDQICAGELFLLFVCSVFL